MFQAFKLRFSKVYKSSSAIPFLVTMLLFGAATGVFSGVLNNFLFEILGISAAERGIIEFPRELPGLLLILIMAFLRTAPERFILRGAMIISSTGLLFLSLFGTNPMAAVFFIILWSTGEHIMMPIRSSIAIHSAQPGREGLAMGMTSSASNIGQVAGYYAVPLLFVAIRIIQKGDLSVLMLRNPAGTGNTPFFFFSSAFILALVFALLGIGFSFLLPVTGKPENRTRLYFDKKFKKYYLLEAFFGARKQVFLTFAPYVLIIYYGATTELIATLYGVWSIATIFIGPAVGRLMDRIGYKPVIVADTVLLVVICLLYGFAHKMLPPNAAFTLVCIVFVLDAILFVVGMARTMYVKALSKSQEEVTGTLSTGISINHLISILIALGGGVLWEQLGMETLFLVAAFFGAGSFIFSLTLEGKKDAKKVSG